MIKITIFWDVSGEKGHSVVFAERFRNALATQSLDLFVRLVTYQASTACEHVASVGTVEMDMYRFSP